MQWKDAESVFIEHQVVMMDWPSDLSEPTQIPGPNFSKRSLKKEHFCTIFKPIVDWQEKGGFTEEKWEQMLSEVNAKRNALEAAQKEGRTLDYTAADCVPSMCPILRVVPWPDG